MQNQRRDRWSSRLAVIFAVAASAVGIGNFLRFPGLVAKYGGAFMIPYFLALVLIAVPMCWAEWIMGRFAGQYGYNSCPAIFAIVGRRPIWRYVGVLAVLIPICVFCYYGFVEAWCLGYAWFYLTGALPQALSANPADYAGQSRVFFDQFIGNAQDGVLLQGPLSAAVACWLIVFAVNFVVIYNGVSRGIERFCNFALPLMLLCSLIVMVRVLTLGAPDPSHPERNVLAGLAYMWNPKVSPGQPWWSALANAEMWLEAAGQVFFSLGVGFGIIATYASYLGPRDDVALSSLTAAATNETAEVCVGGLVTIPAAFVFLGATAIAGQGTFGLGFNTLPAVFMHMPDVLGIPTGRAIGFVWFLMLFLAAITSSLGMVQPAIAFLEEALGIGRRASCALLALIAVFGTGLTIYFSRGMSVVNSIDFWVGGVLVYTLAMFEVVLFAWVFGVERGFAEARKGAAIRIPDIFKFILKWISPTYLGTIFVVWCWRNLRPNIEQLAAGGGPLYAVLLVGVVAAFLVVLVHLAGPRWRAETLQAEHPTAGAEVRR